MLSQERLQEISSEIAKEFDIDRIMATFSDLDGFKISHIRYVTVKDGVEHTEFMAMEVSDYAKNMPEPYAQEMIRNACRACLHIPIVDPSPGFRNWLDSTKPERVALGLS